MNTYLAGPANKQGRICANNIALGNKHQYNGAVNTAIVKVFDMTVATAGTAAKHLDKCAIKYQLSTTHNGSHAGYYPGAKQMTIQLAFTPTDGKLLGAQIIGYDGVDKRIDVLSSVIQRGSSITELTEFEHAYAPPFSSAKDPINIAAFVAENVLLNKTKLFYWNDINTLPDGSFLLDVRTKEEFEKGAIANAINIPLDELRNNLNKIPQNKTIYIYCAGGLRGYLSERILIQNGFTDVYNLSGGYQLWNACNSEKQMFENKNKVASTAY